MVNNCSNRDYSTSTILYYAIVYIVDVLECALYCKTIQTLYYAIIYKWLTIVLTCNWDNYSTYSIVVRFVL